MAVCKSCQVEIQDDEFIRNWRVCPTCGHHHRLASLEWATLLFDDGRWEEKDTPLYATDPLHFVDSKPYKARLQATWDSSGLDDACRNILGTMQSRPVSASILDFFFMGGSMGSVVGEKITRGAERSLELGIPFITVSCSGGARMQEGFYSLMQLVKTSYACGKLRENGVPFISILTDPSTAGVMASFASLGDVIVAEKGALIGFAGPRVIAQTIGGELPEGFQKPEFCQEHGLVDMIVERKDMKETIHRLIGILSDTPTVVGRKKK
ncbi:acetyl-CoA carboxylase carboxyl transferase subunit beta [bacterium]|nr:acetyl-CoA carboxylase carboxyl transferase subunit beta [candidate division CSSED10-310 bacterium]